MTKKSEPEVFLWKNMKNQYFATFAANLLIFSSGAVNGWVSPALSVLASDKSPLISGALTTDEISWIGSINVLGAMMGTLSLGYFISLMGSKRAILLLTIPIIVFWLLVYFGNHYYYLLLGRVFAGIGGGGVLTALILYVSEISDDNIRGRLISSIHFIRNFGILVGFILGASVDYMVIPRISGIFPIVFIVSFVMLPNTPRYHLQKGQIQKAEAALKYYNGFKGKSKQEDDALYKEFERLKSIVNERKTEEKLQASDFFNRSALKGLGIGIILTTLSQLTGTPIITNYAVMIFEKAGTSMDPYVSSIMLGIALLLGSICTTYLADKLGRKFLNIMSLVGSALGLFAVSLYHYLNINGYDLSSYQWVPVLSLSFVIFISAAGIIALSLVCSIEYLPSKIRTPGMAFIGFAFNITTFTSVKLLPFLLEVIDLHGCMTIFGVSCALGAIFIYFFVEETSGQCLDDVG
ncbi:facilitated trehalose transporter Tret1-like, partial [Sitodiplosis mosellana]|uniref:facilitated trehalose transporter Tret1-like n=1 Tax=Sitodiplosis mosellana TaxID=263140 RepID=UPI002443DE4F